MPTTPANIVDRMQELVVTGEALLKASGIASDMRDHSETVSWLLSAMNLLEVTIPANSRYRGEAGRTFPKLDNPVPRSAFGTFLGIFRSAAREWQAGLIRSIELHYAGLTFKDFLGLAKLLVDDGEKDAAAVLASAVPGMGPSAKSKRRVFEPTQRSAIMPFTLDGTDLYRMMFAIWSKTSKS